MTGKFLATMCRQVYNAWCRVVYMMKNTKYGASKTVHLAINDGIDTLPVCNARLLSGLPEEVQTDVTCKKCQKVMAA